MCSALALALTPPGPAAHAWQLTIVPGTVQHHGTSNGHAGTLTPLSLEALTAEFAEGPRRGPVTWRTTCGGRVTLTPGQGGDDEP
jgi:hypothetical protein